MASSNIFDHVISPVPRYMMRLERIQRLFDTQIPGVKRFLEIGPGLGDVAAFLLQRYPDASGEVIEFSKAAAEQLDARFSHSGRLMIHTNDFLTCSSHGGFDLIMAFEVLEHIDEDLIALQRIESALEPGGYLLASVPAYMRKWQKVDEWAGHVRRYEKHELQDKLSKTGFSVRTLWGYGFPVTALSYPLRQLFYRSSKRGASADEMRLATERSGVSRPMHAPSLAPWLARALLPLFSIQHVVRHSSLGDGWIVLAQKK